MCVLVVASSELTTADPFRYDADAGEIRICASLNPVAALRLVQLILLIVGIPQDNDEQAICICGAPIPVFDEVKGGV